MKPATVYKHSDTLSRLIETPVNLYSKSAPIVLSIKISEAGYGINYVHMLGVLAVCQVSSISSISSMIFVDEAREVCNSEPGRLQPCPQASIVIVVGTKTCNPNEWNSSVRVLDASKVMIGQAPVLSSYFPGTTKEAASEAVFENEGLEG